MSIEHYLASAEILTVHKKFDPLAHRWGHSIFRNAKISSAVLPFHSNETQLLAADMSHYKHTRTDRQTIVLI